MFSNLIVKQRLRRTREFSLRPGSGFVVLLLFSFLTGIVSAEDAAFYQKALSPAASRLLFTVQELSRAGKDKAAIKKIEQFKQGQVRNLPPLLGFVAGNLNFKLGNYRKAAGLYRQVVTAAPEFGQALENYGAALLQIEDYREANRVFLQAAAVLPEKSSQLKYKAAVAAIYAGDYKQARSLLVVLTGTPYPPPAAWLKALIQVDWQLSETQAALKTAVRLVDLYPDEIAHWRLYGQVAVAAGSWRKALSAYKVLQVEGHITLKERKLLAVIYQRLDLWAEAAEILAEIYAERLPEARELKQLTDLYRRTGQTEKALETLNRRQQLYPDPMNIFEQGEILYAAGRYREAADIFLSLDKIPEKDGRQYLMAGYCAWNLDDFTAAAGAWQRAAGYPAWQKQAQDLLRNLKPLL